MDKKGKDNVVPIEKALMESFMKTTMEVLRLMHERFPQQRDAHYCYYSIGRVLAKSFGISESAFFGSLCMFGAKEEIRKDSTTSPEGTSPP